MAEMVTAPATETPQPAQAAETPQQAIRFAGRFDTPEAFSNAVVELARETGLPEETFKGRPLYGQGGVYKDLQTAEDAYKKLQAGFTRAHKPELKPEEKQPPPSTDPLKIGAVQEAALDDDATVEQWVDKAGLKWDDVATTWREKKDLTDEQFAAFKKLGIPKSVVRTTIKNAEAAAVLAHQQIRVEAVKVFGSEEKLNHALNVWAPQNLSSQEQKVYNDRLSDPATAKSATLELFGRMASVGAAGRSGIVENGTVSYPGTISTGKQLREIVSKANRGDAHAERILAGIPMPEYVRLMNEQ